MKASRFGLNAVKTTFWTTFGIGLTLLLTAFRADQIIAADPPLFTVVLDAGHGGHDPGNLGNGYYEKNIALSIVLKAGALLEKNPNIKVIYTRKDDTFVDLFERGQIANKAKADLFVSVHCDSHTSNAHGAGTFVLGLHANEQNFEIAKKENSVIYLEDDYKSRYADYDINSPESVIGLTIMQEEFLDQSIALAKSIQDKFSKKLQRVDRKVKQAGFIVLHQTFMPSVLVETGFLTNKQEGAYLNSKKGQSQMGTAIGEAILAYRESAMANVAGDTNTRITDAPDPEADKANQFEREKRAKEEEKTRAKEEALVAEAQRVLDVELAKKAERDAEAKRTAEAKKIAEAKQIAEKTRVAKAEQVAKAKQEALSVEKTKIAEEVKQTEVAQSEKAERASEITYKVQLMASAKEFVLRPSSFNGLNRVAKEPIKGLYRYVYGNTSSLEEARMLKRNADLKGYPTSFIVVYRNGERITFAERKAYLNSIRKE